MTIMIRPRGPKLMRKGKHIAFSILGVPPNMQKQKETPHQKSVNERLIQEDIIRVR